MKNRGFTLVELLITLAIIGLLISVVAVGVDALKKASRDTKRVANMSEFSKALSLIFNEQGSYPISTNNICLTGSDSVSQALMNAKYLNTGVQDPAFPNDITKCYRYQSDALGLQYTLTYFLERSSGTGPQGNNSIFSE